MSGLSWFLLAAVPALPLSLTLLNLATWLRGRGQIEQRPRVSVLIPARNEERSIEACVRASVASRYALHEVIVYDDQSNDATPAILARLARELPMLRSVRGGALPQGWVGKPYACDQLAKAATGDVLLFVDADTRLEPDGVERLLSLLEHGGAASVDVVTAVPRQVMVSFAERLLLPLLHLTYTSWLPLFLVSRSADPRFAAANGQLLALRRDTYTRLGGFASVAHEIVDDVAFCRHAKARGARVMFADGARIAHCRMYHSAQEVWRGFSKNLYEGIGATPLALLVVVSLYLLAFVAPYAGLALSVSAGASALFFPSLVGVGQNILLRAALALRFRQPIEGLLLHPIAVLVLCAIALNSYAWSARGQLHWAGRTYRSRKQRVPGLR